MSRINRQITTLKTNLWFIEKSTWLDYVFNERLMLFACWDFVFYTNVNVTAILTC